MGTFPSARGQKPTEVASRPEGRNTIVVVWMSGGVQHTDWGPDYAAASAHLTIEGALDATLVMGRSPLLWTWAEPDANYTELKFGFDDPIGRGKIGHVALTAEATISGEIYRSGAQWRINNESGAWGNMGGSGGKGLKLVQVAQFMTQHCAGMQVAADAAFSKNLLKRKFRKLMRY